MIDLDVQGTMQLNNGSVVSAANSFYIDFISGSALQATNGGIYNGSTDIGEYNYGTFQYLNGAIRETLLRFNSSDNFLSMDIQGDPTLWALGGSFGTFGDIAYDSSGNSSWLGGGPLTIIDISDQAPGASPVPEPSTFLLLGCGMFLLFLVMQRKQLSNSIGV
jgi:hypothetical protein